MLLQAAEQAVHRVLLARVPACEQLDDPSFVNGGHAAELAASAPGPVETAMAKAVHSPEIRADYRDAVPLGRYGLEEELAEAIFFLCSERATYITGQVLAVDGGFDAAGIGLATLRGERRNL